MTRQERILHVAMAIQTMKIPYKWKGNSPIDGGLDCSGYVCEVLRSNGLIGKEDYSAQMLYDKYKTSKNGIVPGSLLFFGKTETSITHIAIAFDDVVMLEAGGGDSTTDSFEKAIEKNAYVRYRAIASRADKPLSRII